eukprot:gnl/TRDRNA2_/TRDRNA2_176496_c0_seq1.p1 gnl/TRDRNA2_/TRDRNA2_176496_c0~~gnl/TRDRNA2_/TRDRNA2_176496_c0_seq1.p1  ORF type:complete len:977 (-),score=67.06 gnl/TRDRNA2_/TRDRNA2_176496_c0_seq1:70-3000(-)
MYTRKQSSIVTSNRYVHRVTMLAHLLLFAVQLAWASAGCADHNSEAVVEHELEENGFDDPAFLRLRSEHEADRGEPQVWEYGCTWQLGGHRCANINLETAETGAGSPATLAQCQNRCCQKETCKHYTWTQLTVSGSLTWQCLLANEECALGATAVTTNGGAGTKISSVKFERHLYTWCVPDTTPVTASNAGNGEVECMTYCAVTPTCHAWFWKVDNTNTAKCYEKANSCVECQGPTECVGVINGGVKENKGVPAPEPDSDNLLGPTPPPLDPKQALMPIDERGVPDKLASVVGYNKTNIADKLYWDRVFYLKKIECNQYFNTARCHEDNGCQVEQTTDECIPLPFGLACQPRMAVANQQQLLDVAQKEDFLNNLKELGKQKLLQLASLPPVHDGHEVVECDTMFGSLPTAGLIFNYKVTAKGDYLKSAKYQLGLQPFKAELQTLILDQSAPLLTQLLSLPAAPSPGATPATCKDAGTCPILDFEVYYTHQHPHCVTTGPTEGESNVGPGVACLFPFQYGNTVHNTCTSAGWDQLWCPTMGSGDSWGHCADTCNTMASCVTKEDTGPNAGTEEGPAVVPAGHSCHFPFTWKGKVYKECARGINNQYWCPLTGGTFDANTQWGFCGDYCPVNVPATPAPTPAPAPVPPDTSGMPHAPEGAIGGGCKTTGQAGSGPGIKCLFPFKYANVIYNSCSQIDWDRPWCAVKPSANGQRMWGECDRSSCRIAPVPAAQAPGADSEGDPVDPSMNAMASGLGGGGAMCFPGNAKVILPTGPKDMAQLRLGDEVLGYNSLTKQTEFSKVRAWLHRATDVESTFVKLQTSAGDIVTSPGHNMAVGSPDKYVFAHDIIPGSALVTPSGDAIVTNSSWQVGQGVYAPWTSTTSLYVGMGDGFFLAHSLANVHHRFDIALNVLFDILEFIMPSIHDLDEDSEAYLHPVAHIFWSIADGQMGHRIIDRHEHDHPISRLIASVAGIPGIRSQ